MVVVREDPKKQQRDTVELMLMGVKVRIMAGPEAGVPEAQRIKGCEDPFWVCVGIGMWCV
jgi:hypothetical protein